MKHFYLTTAIDYANGKPHLGHAYEKVLADVIARFKRLQGNDVHFLTGLDEHGQKVQQTAEKREQEPQTLCDEMAQAFQGLCAKLNLSHDDYIRTTQPRHKKVVQAILQDLYDKGEIYKDEYQGYYSTKEEQFLQEKDRNDDGSWPAQYGEVSEVTESNYFFKLSQYQDWLIEHIEGNPDFIFPKNRAKQLLEFLKDPMNDLCISRPKERLSWGIELPFDSGFVTYVWFDALINYISAVGYGTEDFNKYWPVDHHIIGKDILIPAHGVYWPCMLKAIGVEMPKNLVVHGWWMCSGEKMSKSVGNVVDPLKVIDIFGADPFRYFLMREMNVGKDSNFSIELFQSRYNDELANDLGNLVSRMLNMLDRYCDKQIPTIQSTGQEEEELQALWQSTHTEALELCEGLQFHTALERTFAFIRAINRYIEQSAPWKLAKSEDGADLEKLKTCLATVAEAIRLSSTILTPFIPEVSSAIQKLLGANNESAWTVQLNWSNILEGNTVGNKTILFPRIDLESITA